MRNFLNQVFKEWIVRTLSFLTAVACLAATVSVQGCSTAQLQGFNQQMANLNNGTASVANPGPPMPQFTAAQQQQLLSQINQPQTQLALRVAVRQAAPTMQKVLQFLACYPGLNPQKYLQQYVVPNDVVAIFYSPMSRMRYASKSQCVNITRIDGWRMHALNAFSFSVVYTSALSGEDATMQYAMVKGADGTWLFTYR